MKKELICFFILILFLIPVMISMISAATINAVSCSQIDVQNAINQAQAGDIVQVPEGECIWSSPSYSILGDGYYPAIGINKSIILRGAGIDLTNISDSTPSVYNRYLIRIKDIGGFRITGFTFKNLNLSGIGVSSSNNWRIDNCKFVNGSAGVFTSGNSPYGVVDNCIFVGSEVTIFDDESGSWNRPLTLGTKNAVYVENNVFYEYNNCGNDAIDGRSGGRIVFRNNDLHNMMLHLHGTDGGGLRGTHSYEYYGNKMYDDAGLNCYRYGSIRGGTGVIWNNTAYGNWGGFYAEHNCACTTDPNDGRCGGAKFCTSYPCLDQIGRTTDHDNDGVQDLIPLFVWNNTVNSAIKNITVAGCEAVQNIYLKEERDFYNGGVVYNPLNEIFEAQYRDDDGSTKQWTYKPYVYPHPLTITPFGTNICNEGEITEECWCEGMKSIGYCYSGYYYTEEGERIEPPPEIPTLDIVTLQDMLGAYQQYKRNEVSLIYFLDKLKRWIVFW